MAHSSSKQWQWSDAYDTPRDMVGYGHYWPRNLSRWPNNAKIAISFVINYEEGGEHTVLNGDSHSEIFLTENVDIPRRDQSRDMNAESMYEYGSRAGIWRLLQVFERAGVKGTLFGVGKALELNPEVSNVASEIAWEVAAHGWRWVDYQDVSVNHEGREMEKCIDLIAQQTGQPPRGWYIGRQSPQSRTILYDIYKSRNIPLLWISDDYSDDLPFWKAVPKGATRGADEAQLILPYTLDCNDCKYLMPNNWSSSDDFLNYLKETFDELYSEGEEGQAKMMSIGLHARISGRPGRVGAVRKFVEYVQSKDDVWIATREEIAQHWMRVSPYRSQEQRPQEPQEPRQ